MTCSPPPPPADVDAQLAAMLAADEEAAAAEEGAAAAAPEVEAPVPDAPEPAAEGKGEAAPAEPAAPPAPVVAAPPPPPAPAAPPAAAVAPVLGKKRGSVAVPAAPAVPSAAVAPVVGLAPTAVPTPAAAAQPAAAAKPSPASALAVPAAAAPAPPVVASRRPARPAALAVAPAAAATTALAPSAATAATAAAAPARTKSAYQFFCDAKRAGVVAANPGAAFADVAKALGAAWAAEADKAPYEAAAAAAKAAAPPKPAGGGGGGRAKKGGPAGPSAYGLFCADMRPTLAAANPGADVGAMSRLLGAAWKGADAGVKAQYEAAAGAAKAACAAAAGGGGGGGAPAAAAKKKRKAPRPDAADPEFDAQATANAAGRPSPAERSVAEDDAERAAVDWAAHPATAVLGETERGHYIVARAGLALSDYGLVDAAAAKRARLGGGGEVSDADTDAAAALPPALVDEYEASASAFDTALHAHTEGNALDLDGLAAGDALEACAFLGALREDGYPLHGRAAGVRCKKDRLISVPMLGLSRLVQRALDVERAGRAKAEAELAALKATLGGGA